LTISRSVQQSHLDVELSFDVIEYGIVRQITVQE
jgi:hypothetical protein